MNARRAVSAIPPFVAYRTCRQTAIWALSAAFCAAAQRLGTVAAAMHLSWIDIFVLVSGAVGIVATVPLVYLAVRSHREGRELRRVQEELARLISESKEISEEVRELQHEALQRVDGLHGPRRRRPSLRRNRMASGEGADDADSPGRARLARIAQARNRARPRVRA